MLFRTVRPMRRDCSRNQYFNRRVPADVRRTLSGPKTLHVPLADKTVPVTITASTAFVKFSLRTREPAEVKARNAAADAYLEGVWQAFRQAAPLRLTNEQATALSGRLYRAWVSDEGRERTTTVEQGPDGKMQVVVHDPSQDDALFEASLARLVRPATIGKPLDLDNLPPADEKPEPGELETRLGPLVDRLFARGAHRQGRPAVARSPLGGLLAGAEGRSGASAPQCTG
jgi:hypothetical protein